MTLNKYKHGMTLYDFEMQYLKLPLYNYYLCYLIQIKYYIISCSFSVTLEQLTQCYIIRNCLNTALQWLRCHFVIYLKHLFAQQTRNIHKNVTLMLVHSLRRWPKITVAFGECFVFCFHSSSVTLAGETLWAQWRSAGRQLQINNISLDLS